MQRILVCGEALIDELHSPVGVTFALGGGPFNVARTVGRLGGRVALVTRLSTDADGERLLAALDNDQVDTSLIQRGNEPSMRARVVTGSMRARHAAGSMHVRDAAGRPGTNEFSFELQGTATASLDVVDLPADCGWLCVGSLSLHVEPGASHYRSLINQAVARGVPILLDPNVRPGAFADDDRVRRDLRDLVGCADLLKLSDEDADWLGLDPASPLGRNAVGPAAVVCTHGAEGLTVYVGGEKLRIAAPEVSVADTVGAGDSIAGALLHYFGGRGADRVRSSVASWREPLTYAAAVAAVTVSRVGADPPWAFELSND